MIVFIPLALKMLGIIDTQPPIWLPKEKTIAGVVAKSFCRSISLFLWILVMFDKAGTFRRQCHKQPNHDRHRQSLPGDMKQDRRVGNVVPPATSKPGRLDDFSLTQERLRRSRPRCLQGCCRMRSTRGKIIPDDAPSAQQQHLDPFNRRSVLAIRLYSNRIERRVIARFLLGRSGRTMMWK